MKKSSLVSVNFLVFANVSLNMKAAAVKDIDGWLFLE